MGIGFLSDGGWGVVGLVWAIRTDPNINEPAAVKSSKEAFILYPFRQSF
jgi:hypothetical protein